MFGQRHPRPKLLEGLVEAHQLEIVEVVQAAVLDHLDQVIQARRLLVKRMIHRRVYVKRHSAGGWRRHPRGLDSILLERVFD